MINRETRLLCFSLFEPPHEKTNKMTVRPSKTQVSLGIRPESSLCAQWVAKDPSFLRADSEDSDQTERMPRLIWVFAGRTCHFVGFVMRRLCYVYVTVYRVVSLVRFDLLLWHFMWNVFVVSAITFRDSVCFADTPLLTAYVIFTLV